MKCADCHTGAEKAARAGFPQPRLCAACHPDAPPPAIPSQRLYRNKDYVYFSHARHAAPKSACTDCHGDVWTQSPLKRHRGTSMADCVDCHRERKATLVCNACHDLGQ
jgi:hypothetical protein